MLSSPSFGSHHECSNSIPSGEDRPIMRRGVTPSSYAFRFRFAREFLILRLAYMLDSLVRVPRRVVQGHFTNIKKDTSPTLHRDERRLSLVSQTRAASALPTSSGTRGFPLTFMTSPPPDVGNGPYKDPKSKLPETPWTAPIPPRRDDVGTLIASVNTM